MSDVQPDPRTPQGGAAPGPMPVQVSLTGPVLFLAFAAATVMSLPVLLGQAGLELFCFQNCCGGVTVGLLGILPVRMFLRQGVVISPVLGFVIPLLGVFMGGLIAAILQMSVGMPRSSDLLAASNKMFETFAAESERQGRPVEFNREELGSAFVGFGRYAVLMLAIGGAVFAGAVGFVAAGIAHRIRPPGGPEEPDG